VQGTVTLTGNVIARSLEFYEKATDYTLKGDIPSVDGVPVRSIQINTEMAFRSIYLHPDAHVTVRGEAETGLRIYKAGNMQIYGGGLLTIGLNGMVRTEGGGNMVLNDGTTVEVLTGGQFNASRDLYIGDYLPTFEGAGGDAHLILDGGSSTTRTGGAGGDVYIGGPTGTAEVTVKNGGMLTVAALATNGIRFGGNGILRLEAGGVVATRKIEKISGATGEAVVRFDGGTLVVNALPASGATIIGTDVDHVYVAEGGAVVDTNGFNVTLSAALQHDPETVGVDGGLTKKGTGKLTLTGGNANTFNGIITVQAGSLVTSSFDSLGDAGVAPSNFVLDGGTWEHTGGAATSRGITVTANGGTLAGNTAWRINGQVAGAADSTLYIAGNAWLSGNNTTTFFGTIDVLSGEFLVRKAASLGSSTGGVIVRSGATFSLDHNGTGGGNNDSSDNTYSDDLVLDAGATLRTRGANSTVAASIYEGDITLTGPGDSVIDVSNIRTEIAEIPDLTVTGAVGGDGGLRKIGGGRLIITNATTYAGKTTVAGGEMVMSDSGFGGIGSVDESPWIEVAAGAVFDTTVHDLEGGYGFASGDRATRTLSGTGTFRGNTSAGNGLNIKIGGTSTGNQGMTNLAAAGDLTGTLTFDGDLGLADSTVFYQIGGAADFDVLTITGDLSVTGETQFVVNWANGFVASVGQSFDLLNWGNVSPPDWSEFSEANLDLSAAVLAEGMYWDTSQFIVTGTITAAPEPGRALLLLMALGAVGLRRRRPSSAQRMPPFAKTCRR
jgi:autotransporter-associated beta strand protein